MIVRSRALLVLILLSVLLYTPAWALPLTSFLEATAVSGWQGAFAVRFTDGTLVTGVHQVSGFPARNFQSLPLVTEGCTVSPGCREATLTTGTVVTMTSLGQTVLAITSGTLAGTTLTTSTFSFDFSSTLTASFISSGGGQALSSVRLDLTDGTAPPLSRTLLSDCCLVNEPLAAFY